MIDFAVGSPFCKGLEEQISSGERRQLQRYETKRPIEVVTLVIGYISLQDVQNELISLIVLIFWIITTCFDCYVLPPFLN